MFSNQFERVVFARVVNRVGIPALLFGLLTAMNVAGLLTVSCLARKLIERC